VPLKTVEQVLALYQEKYYDLNVRHFREKLRVNLLAVNSATIGSLLASFATESLVGNHLFFGRPVRLGSMLVYGVGNALTTHGPLSYERTAKDDAAYVPYQRPIPPDCGLVQDLVRSGVKMVAWKFNQNREPQDGWLRQAAQHRPEGSLDFRLS
jgi:hypothetical protein